MAAATSSSAPDGAPPPPEHEPSTIEPPQPSPPSNSPPKKTAPLPWSHMETIHLIESYQEKWYSLKRGQLKASQWEEVSISVAARCGYDEPSKTATQCRHKMEKLRKRYRSEKQRLSPSLWPYFNLMDRMERGPFPISACPISSSVDHLPRNRDDEDEDDDDDDNYETNKSRSINHILRRPPMASRYPPPQWSDGSGGVGGRGPPGVSRFSTNPMFRKRKSFEMDEEEDGVDPISELASVVRAFGEGFVRIENMKMEMMKETERYRMEMEAKRTEMIIESQSRIIDAIAKSLGSQKSKKTQEL